MASAFLQLAHRVLQEEQRPLTVPEIWELAQSRGYDKELATKGKTPSASLGAMLYVDVRDNAQSEFAAVGTRPKRFVLRSMASNIDTKIVDVPAPAKEKKWEYLEKDLHPFMAYFGFYYLRAYLKTIHHNKSGKKDFGEWVHPDMVGSYFPFSDWQNEVVEVSSAMGNTAVKLFSFELKRELSIGNLREAFFQAVSNSSWANEGYLAAAEIDDDEDFQTELERLSTSFGIGVIHIDVDDPDSTRVMLPSRSKELVDWETVNKLANINPDFREFLRRVKTDIQSREIRREMYDRVSEKEELIALVTRKR